MEQNKLRQLFKSGNVTVGMLIGIPTPTIVDMAGCAGFDWLVLDTEHCTYDLEVLENMARAADSRGVPTLVRVYGPDPHLITKVLDTGVDGVMLARCSTKQQAEDLVKFCRLPPLGDRGPEPATRAAMYGTMTMKDYERRVNDAVVAIMIETKEGLENIDELMSVPGIDAVAVGPSDLSWSLGVERGGPEFREAAYRVYKSALAAGVIPIRTLLSPEAIRDYLPREGELRVFHWAADRLVITRYLQEGVKKCKEIAGEYLK